MGASRPSSVVWKLSRSRWRTAMVKWWLVRSRNGRDAQHADG